MNFELISTGRGSTIIYNSSINLSNMAVNDDGRNENWSALLRAFYENETAGVEFPTSRGAERYIKEDSQFIQHKTNLTSDEADKAVKYLIEVDLLTQKGGRWVMSDKGFQVAHQRWIQEREDQRIREQEANEDQRARRQHEINRAIAFLSLGLLVVTVLDSATRIFVGMEAYLSSFGAIGLGLLFIIVFTGVMNNFGLLSKDPVE